jgi:CRISPR-associated protein Cst1
MLRYTGHPFVDIGVATITAFAGKHDPSQLVLDDLERMADYIEREYLRDPLKSFLTVAFTSNSGFSQPAFNNQPEKRVRYARQVSRAFRPETPTRDVPCAFTGEPSAGISFDVHDNLAPGCTFRQHIPLLTGEDVINFHPNGIVGVPVSGKAMLALQAFPLGCAKCGGRLLAVHSDNDEITLHFAAAFLQANRRAVQLAQQAGSSKMAEAERTHHTLLIETLLNAERMQRYAKQDQVPFSLTAYHLTNSGQGVDLDIYHLPLQTIGFLGVMQQARFTNTWRAIVRCAWEIEPPRRSSKQDLPPFQPRRNHLYEDVFRLPANAPHFIRTYFLRQPLRQAREDLGDPRGGYSPQRDLAMISWTIADQFLRRIVNMHKERIEQISVLGDRLAQYVANYNDRHFFREFYRQQRYDYLRTLLIRANLTQVKGGGAPLFGLDPYLTVFEEGDEVVRTDWRLVRDLVLIRMIEQLYNQGWLGGQTELLAEATEEEPVQTSSKE